VVRVQGVDRLRVLLLLLLVVGDATSRPSYVDCSMRAGNGGLRIVIRSERGLWGKCGGWVGSELFVLALALSVCLSLDRSFFLC